MYYVMYFFFFFINCATCHPTSYLHVILCFLQEDLPAQLLDLPELAAHLPKQVMLLCRVLQNNLKIARHSRCTQEQIHVSHLVWIEGFPCNLPSHLKFGVAFFKA